MGIYLTFIEFVETPKGKAKKAAYKCICGVEKIINYYDVISGHTVSCGCIGLKNRILSKTKHGLKNHPLHGVWCRMKNRCYNKKGPRYSAWGGRGIKICEEWRYNFVPFYEWALKNGWQNGLQIDRIDNDGDYSPNNCRFVTPKMNSNNTRSNRIILHEGCYYTLSELSYKYNIRYGLLKDRLNSGWDIKRAIDSPTIEYSTIAHEGQVKSVSEWAKYIGIKEQTLRRRLRSGWDIEKALSSSLIKNQYGFKNIQYGIKHCFGFIG